MKHQIVTSLATGLIFTTCLEAFVIRNINLHQTKIKLNTKLRSQYTTKIFNERSKTSLFQSISGEYDNTAIPRRPIAAGNWKLNPANLSDASSLAKLLSSNLLNQSNTSSSEVVIFPPMPYLSTTLSLVEGSGIKIGSQDVGPRPSGAFTGEVSPSMLRSLGIEYVLLGHSERRTVFGETDAVVNEKMRACLSEPGLKVILCVGETEEEYGANLLSSVVSTQVRKALLDVAPADVVERVVIAYEPIWAIGTGKVATPTQAQVAHEAVRGALADSFGEGVARGVRIQYGGSVNPSNVDDIMAQPDVDGVLVGGASLQSDAFTRIVHGVAASAGDQKQRNDSTSPRYLAASEVVTCKNVLGESPVWSVRNQALYWVSAPEEELWTWNLKDAPYRRLFGTTLGHVALMDSEWSVLLGGESSFLSVAGYDTFEANKLCDRPERTLPTRPNDARVDRRGRLVFGMYNNYHRQGSSVGENNAGLYRMGADLIPHEILDYKFRCSNVICFPGDGETMYFCDTPTRKVYAFDYNSEDNDRALTNRRLVWTMPADWDGGPDGAQVDSDGFLWIAISGAGKVVRLEPSVGVIDMIVELPVKSPTSVTFGGKDLDELFITTRGPDGGGLYRVKMPFGIKGLPEPEFQTFYHESSTWRRI